MAQRLSHVDADFVGRQHALLTALDLPTEPPKLPAQEVLAVMARDKKAEAGRLRFVLPSHLGHVELVAGIAEADVRAALNVH